MVRILLADDHGLVLEGIKHILETEFEVVGMVKNGQELLDQAPVLKPDIVQVDISMPLVNGIEASRQLKKLLPHVKILVVTMLTNPVYIREAFASGVSGYVLKQAATSELILAIKTILRGERYISPVIAEEVEESLFALGRRPASDGLSGKLTERQKRVLHFIANGFTAKEIARKLDISVKTVEFHKTNIKRILGAKTRADLTKYALGEGIISP